MIDVDILLFDKGEEGKFVPQVVAQENLQIPHPRMHQRLFAVEPLAEIAKDYMVPGVGKTVGALKKELKKKKI